MNRSLESLKTLLLQRQVRATQLRCFFMPPPPRLKSFSVSWETVYSLTVSVPGSDSAQSGESWDTRAHGALPAQHWCRRQEESWIWRPETLLPRRLLHLPAESCSVPGTWGERPVARSSTGCIFCCSFFPFRLWMCSSFLLQFSAAQEVLQVYSSGADAKVREEGVHVCTHCVQLCSDRCSITSLSHSSPTAPRSVESSEQTERDAQPVTMETLALITTQWLQNWTFNDYNMLINIHSSACVQCNVLNTGLWYICRYCTFIMITPSAATASTGQLTVSFIWSIFAP